jgi:hypothetical protein
MREHQPRLLVIWGKYDCFFDPGLRVYMPVGANGPFAARLPWCTSVVRGISVVISTPLSAMQLHD